MSAHNIQFLDKIKKKHFPKYLFSGAIGRISYGLQNEFELAMINEPSVFESSRFYCSWIRYNVLMHRLSSDQTYGRMIRLMDG